MSKYDRDREITVMLSALVLASSVLLLAMITVVAYVEQTGWNPFK